DNPIRSVGRLVQGAGPPSHDHHPGSDLRKLDRRGTTNARTAPCDYRNAVFHRMLLPPLSVMEAVQSRKANATSLGDRRAASEPVAAEPFARWWPIGQLRPRT